MFRLLRVFLHDGLSWVLAVVLAITLVFSMAHLFQRYDKLDVYKYNLWELEGDIVRLQAKLESQRSWMSRLEDDPMAWEQVARDKMNFLGPKEVLVTFRPEMPKED